MNKCSECGKQAKAGSISGRLEGTKKSLTLCFPCFNSGYELVPKQKTNVFRKKKGDSS